jgi:hypothetical protein
VILLVTGLIDYLLCKDERNIKPTYLFVYIIYHKENYGVDGNVAKVLLKYNLLSFVFKCDEHLYMNYEMLE